MGLFDMGGMVDGDGFGAHPTCRLTCHKSCIHDRATDTSWSFGAYLVLRLNHRPGLDHTNTVEGAEAALLASAFFNHPICPFEDQFPHFSLTYRPIYQLLDTSSSIRLKTNILPPNSTQNSSSDLQPAINQPNKPTSSLQGPIHNPQQPPKWVPSSPV